MARAPQAHTIRAMQSASKAVASQEFVGPTAYSSASAFRAQMEADGCWTRQNARRDRKMNMVVTVHAFRK